MTNKYIAYPWPEYQEYMGEEWFREECYYCADKDVYFIPVNRVNESGNKEIRKDIISNLKRYINCIKDGYDAPSAKDFVIKEIKKQIAWLEKQGKKKLDDEVEPKFHKGEWIVFNGLTLYIKEVVKGYYRTISFDGINNSYDWDIDNIARLWTIQDARDGDVLVSRSPFIYGKQCPYGGLNWCNNKFIKASNFIFTDSPVHPATKEQRDFLFQKMKEAEYIFDFEKKELKKLGQSKVTKTSDQEEIAEIPFGAKDSELQEATYFIPKGFYAEIDDDKVVIKKGEKPTAWSEDDEHIKKRLINLVNEVYNNTNYITFLEHKELLAWLEKLDDNIEL